MSGFVLVGPPGRVETECIAQALLGVGVRATAGPDVAHAIAVVAVALPGAPLDETIARLRERTTGLPLLLVAAEVDDETLALARANDAVGLVARRATTRMLADAVHALLHGTSDLPSVRPSVNAIEPLETLTDREREIVTLLSEGRRNDEIATALGISYHTVRTHVAHVLTKLDVPHRHAVAVMARRRLEAPRRISLGETVPVGPPVVSGANV